MPYPIGPGMVWAGPSVGKFLNGKMKLEMDIFGMSISQEEDITDGPAEEAEYGIIIGYSNPLPIMNGKLSLNAGYYLGLKKHKLVNEDTGIIDDITFNSIFAHFSYRL